MLDLYFRRKGDGTAHSLGSLAKMRSIIQSGNGRERPMNALNLPGGHLPLDVPRLL